MVSTPIESYVRNLNELVLATRVDGRSELQHRTVHMKTGIVTQASGSAYIEAGKQKIICAVYADRICF